MRCWMLVLLAAPLLATPARGETRSGGPSLEALAGMYRSGNRETAVTLAMLRRPDAAEAAARQLLDAAAHADGVDELERRETLRFAAAAVLTESARSRLGAGGGERLAPELRAAAHLVGAAPLQPSNRLFARRFYLLAGLTLQGHVELEATHDLLRDGLQRIPDDPELIAALGSVIEAVASVRRYGSPMRTRSPGAGRPGEYGTERGDGGSLPGASLRQAETHYQRALALDPRLAEARLRLGHVRLRQGRAQAALLDLERVAREADRPAQRYLARLFEGRARERLGDDAGAAAALRAAVADAPRAQTALLALGRSLDRLGDGTGAQQAFTSVSEPDTSFDPWWGYLLGQPERIDELVAGLRELVR